MPKRDKMSSAEKAKRPGDKTDGLDRVVDLARNVLRERGLTDEQIDALLRRRKAPDNLN